jgi:hypothetical protein
MSDKSIFGVIFAVLAFEIPAQDFSALTSPLDTSMEDTFAIIGNDAALLKRFKTIAEDEFGMLALDFAFPPEYLKDYIHDEALILYVITRKDAFPAHFLVMCFSYPDHCWFMVFDAKARKISESPLISGAKGVFSPERIEKSIRGKYAFFPAD